MKLAADLLFLAIVIFLFIVFVKGAMKVLGQRPGVLASGIALAWLGLQASLAANGFFTDFSGTPPRLFLLLAPWVIFLLIIAFLPRTGKWVAALPQSALSGIQAFRIPMEIVLWMLFTLGIIPVQMTFEDRNLDIVSGILGGLVGLLLWRGVRLPGWLIIVWNLAGLGLLLNIVITAIQSTPTFLRTYMEEPANTIVAEFPYVWLPGFVVPMAFLLHVLSIRKALLKA